MTFSNWIFVSFKMTDLIEFFKLYGTDTTTNFDLKKIANQLGIKNFHVLMRDELQLIKNKPTVNFITNLHTSDQNGVHWSAGVKNHQQNYYFDSYGLPPTNEVREILGNGIYNTFQIQKPGTTYCGQLCLYVLYKLQKGVPFLDIMLELNDKG